LHYQIPNCRNQGHRLGYLAAPQQLGRPFPAVKGQAARRRVHASPDHVETIGQQAQPEAFGAVHRHEHRPPIQEPNVVVVLCLVRNSLACYTILARAERIAARQAAHSSTAIPWVKNQIAWTKHRVAPPCSLS
jgi:hypothetical protein